MQRCPPIHCTHWVRLPKEPISYIATFTTASAEGTISNRYSTGIILIFVSTNNIQSLSTVSKNLVMPWLSFWPLYVVELYKRIYLIMVHKHPFLVSSILSGWPVDDLFVSWNKWFILRLFVFCFIYSISGKGCVPASSGFAIFQSLFQATARFR